MKTQPFPGIRMTVSFMKHCEATETQVWLDFAEAHQYIEKKSVHVGLQKEYGHIIAMIKNIINNVNQWTA